MAEDPGSHDEATFYVTHLREPVSHEYFKNTLVHHVVMANLTSYSFMGAAPTKMSRSMSQFECEIVYFFVYYPIVRNTSY